MVAGAGTGRRVEGEQGAGQRERCGLVYQTRPGGDYGRTPQEAGL